MLKGKRTFIFITIYIVGIIFFSIYVVNKTVNISNIAFSDIYSLIKDLMGFLTSSIAIILGYVFTKKKFIDGGK